MAAAAAPLVGCATDDAIASDGDGKSAEAKQAMLASAAAAGLLFTATPGADLYALFASANAVNGTVYFPANASPYIWGGAQGPLTIGNAMSVVGDGRGTYLNPNGDGFVLATSDVIGARRIGDFFMQGQNVGTGIRVEGAPRVTGVLFENLQVDNFEIGIDAVGLWHSTFHQVVVNTCRIGVRLAGQCIANCLSACRIQVGADLNRADSIGVLVEPGPAGRPEDVKITDGTLVFGFATNVDVRSCLHFGLLESDLDFSGQFGIKLGQVDGGCSIAGNYLAAHGAGCVLIEAESLPGINHSPLAIERNNLSPSSDFGGQTGIRIGANREGIKSVRANQVQSLAMPLHLIGVTGAIIEGNFLQGPTYSQASKGNIYRNNWMDHFWRDTPLAGSDRDQFDENARGGLVSCFHGPVTIEAYQTSVTVPLPIIQGHPSYLRIRSQAFQFDGELSRGKVRALNNYAGGVRIEVEVPFGHTMADVWLDVEAF